MIAVSLVCSWVFSTKLFEFFEIRNEKPQYLTVVKFEGSMFDHSRDLLHMVNHFRDEIQQPIVGVGHSIGCTQM